MRLRVVHARPSQRPKFPRYAPECPSPHCSMVPGVSGKGDCLSAGLTAPVTLPHQRASAALPESGTLRRLSSGVSSFYVKPP